MDEPTRVLHVLASLDRGGAESVVMDWLRHVDRSLVTFDFVVNPSSTVYAYEEEAVSLGARVFRVPFSPVDAIRYVRWWVRILRQHPEWSIVHAHHTSPAALYLSVARARGLKTIAHSHTAGRDASTRGRLKVLTRWPLRYISHVKAGCSQEAIRWMFGRHIVENAHMVPNSILSEAFAFSPEGRARIRDEFGLGEDLVVGHVGRLTAPKNHLRLLEIFAEFSKLRADSRLLLVGDGALRKRLEHRAQELQIRSKVKFAGSRSDVRDLLSAMDIMLFPSLYEGLPTSVVEAQANGLPCLVSTAVTPEVGLTESVQFLSLSHTNHIWAERLQRTQIGVDRARGPAAVAAAGYDINSAIERVLALYGVEAVDAPHHFRTPDRID